MSTAVIVGSGPNGLSAACRLAREGVSVTVIEAAGRPGGGARSSELTEPGLIHDECAAIHPMGVASPAFEDLGLERHGVEWLWPEVDVAHPLEDGTSGAMYRSVERTAEGLGEDGDAWIRAFRANARAFPDLREEILGPIVHFPRRPLALARFGLPSLRSAESFAGRFRTDQAIADALLGLAAEHGVRVEAGRRVGDLAELGEPDLVLLDLSPKGVLEVTGSRMPKRIRKAYRRYRYGPGSFKLDLAVEGGIPWRDEASRRAGTVHVGGRIEEIARAEQAINRGEMPERPFVLVAQQYLADPSRSVGDLHPVWIYGHVPSGYPGDASEAILAQVERFAPGFRERIRSTFTRSTLEFPVYNENYVEGDIAVGANSARQLVFRPRVGLDPWATGIPGVFICSQATPPGGGVHGMCGWHAAQRALRHLERS